MTPAQAFTYGFLARCVSEGITHPAEQQPLVDQAVKMANLVGTVKDLAGLGLGTLGVGLLAPPIIGYTGGTLAARASDIGDTDVDEAKKQEVIDEYRRQTTRLREMARTARAGQPTGQRHSPIFSRI